MKILQFMLVVCLTPVFFSCASAAPEPDSHQERSALTLVSSGTPADVTAIQFAKIDRQTPSITEDARNLLSVFVGAPVVAAPHVLESLSVPDLAGDGTAAQSKLIRMNHPTLQDLRIEYHSRSDTLDVRNVALTSIHTHQPSDVSEAAARAIAQKTFNALLNAGVVTATHVDFNESTTHTTTEAQGSSDGTHFDSWVGSYLFFAPMRINGLAVLQEAHDLGVLIEVRRSGEIRRVRVDALGVMSNEPGSLVAGETVPVALQPADAQAEASTGFSNPVVDSVGVRYIFPPNGNTDPAIPRQVYRVHSEFAGVGGATGRTKALILSYSLDSPAPIREVFPKSAAVVLKSDTK